MFSHLSHSGRFAAVETSTSGVRLAIGSAVVTYMHHRRPDKTAALILSGTGYNPTKDFAHRRIKAYREQGLDYRWGYTFEDLSPAFLATPLARFFADLFAERNRYADLETVIRQFEAHAQPDAEDHQARVACPTIVLSGSEDATHQSAFALKARIPGCEMKILPGAGTPTCFGCEATR